MNFNGYKELWEKLSPHLAHRSKVKLVYYGKKSDPDNIAVECEWCNEVLVDIDKPEAE